MEKGNLKIQFLRFKAGLLTKNELFENLWHSHGKKISYYIKAFLVSEGEQKDDLFQEVMLKIYNNLESYNPLYSFETWACKITRHHCIDYLKSTRPVVHNFIEEDILSEKATPEQQYISKEIMQEVTRAISKLTPAERELAFLRLYENMTYQAISDITGENINTLKTRMQKIKQKLSRELKEINQ